MRLRTWLLALTAAAFPMVAVANPGVSGPPSNPSFNVSSPASVLNLTAGGDAFAPPALALTTQRSVSVVPYPHGVYRPRARRSPVSVMPITAQFHLGFFYPIDNFSNGFEGGFRVGPQLDPHIQVGAAMDWWHQSSDRVLDLGTVEAPGGTATQKLILSESTADLLPMMVFVQVSGDENMSVIPYGGLGIGHEWLFLTANNYLTHESFDQTFGGFAWRAWVGAGLPLNSGIRLNGEVFFNGGEVGSDMDVDIAGYGPATVRDVINMNGVGMRLGISWGF